MIKSRLDPLKNSIIKSRRTDSAFDLIWKSFTYGKKLRRKKISKIE